MVMEGFAHEAGRPVGVRKGVHDRMVLRAFPTGVRAFIVAMKRLITVERRDAGRWNEMMEDGRKRKPAQVPIKARQAGETLSVKDWAEPSVWTDRMLEALDKGVKGGMWFSLIDKVYSEKNLLSSFKKVRKNRGGAGVDHQSIDAFEGKLEENLKSLGKLLKDGLYHPQAIRRVWIPKPGSKEKRPLGIPTVRDRVAQTALRNVIEPIFEKTFHERSYGFRPGRGCFDALAQVESLLERNYFWVVDVDIKSFFDTIPKDRLMERVREKIADGRVLELLESYLNQKVMEAIGPWTPLKGTPQGAVISPLLANIYLNPFDHMLAGKGFEAVRYADDFVILCRTEEEAKRALKQVRMWMEDNLLTLHPEKTRIVYAARKGGFDFLGYHFEQGTKRPSMKSMKKFKEAVKEKTHRANGLSLKAIISELNPSLRGLFAYFKYSHPRSLIEIDVYVRHRIRCILRKRRGLKGRARGNDYVRWPLEFFNESGLFSLETAFTHFFQSSIEVRPPTGEPCAIIPHARFGGGRDQVLN
jgi:RNA-directed DNA polymerase